MIPELQLFLGFRRDFLFLLFFVFTQSLGLAWPATTQDVPAIPSWEFRPQPGMDQPYISIWRIIGPFDWTEAPIPPVSADHNDAVARQLDHAFIPELEASNSAPYMPSTRRVSVQVVNTSNGLVRLHRILPRFRYQVSYAECNVVSDHDDDAILLPESDDGIKVWLNGRVVAEITAIRKVEQFTTYVRVRLHRGSNHLLVKLARTRQTEIWDPWDFAVGLRSSRGALDEISGRGVPPFFSNAIVGPGAQLLVDLSLFASGERLTVTLQEGDKQHIFNLTGGQVNSVPMKEFSSGVVYATLKSNERQFAEPILYGVVDDFANHYRTILPKYYSDVRNQLNLGALLFRFEHLMDPSYRENDNQLWQKKIAQLAWQIETILSDANSGREPYHGKAGTWLRSFQSKVDGSTQYYLVHAPPQAEKGNAFPLVIIVPYEEIPLRPFPFEIPVAEYSVLKIFDRAADLNGFGYIWTNERGNTYGQEFGRTALFETLAEVQRDYKIDSDRIYLFGVCSGGLHALSLAADHPDLFAAVGVLTPVARYRRVTVFDPPSPTDAYACEDLKRRSPIHRMENLINVPVMIVHGDDDSHNPISESKQLAAEANSAGVQLTFLVEHGGTELRFTHDPRYTIFDFFRKQSLRRNPPHVIYNARSEDTNQVYWLKIDQFLDPLQTARIEARVSREEIDVTTQNVARFSLLPRMTSLNEHTIRVMANGSISVLADLSAKVVPVDLDQNAITTTSLHGPLSTVFTQPFLVVSGTEGPDSADAAAQAAAFIKSWEARFFATPPSKKDIELTDLDFHDYNLVLFGTERSNRVIAKLSENLPVHYSEKGISIGERFWEGQGYSVQAVFPNPLQPDRYVVLTGDPRCTRCRADALQFTLHSWYDAAVWRQQENGYAQLVDVGYFDQSWHHFVPAASCR